MSARANYAQRGIMGLRKLCLLVVLATVGTLAFAPSALAWTFSASGSAKCDSATGQYVVTWTLDNRSEPETLTVRESNRTAAVAVGSTVGKRTTADFVERLAAGTTGSVTLTVKGNWPSDKVLRTRTATVSLAVACVPPDVCPNITGIQTSVPAGMVKDAQGNCSPPPPTDVCPNIEGVQTSVPAGMVKDALGACSPPPPPTDVCANIEGIQTATPAGWVNENGHCHCPPQIRTVTEERVVEKLVPVEKIVTVQAAPRVVTKVVIKKIKVKVKPKKKKAKTKVKGVIFSKRRPGVLPFTP
jgi:hypothetical protein